jgi:hypothetical protein
MATPEKQHQRGGETVRTIGLDENNNEDIIVASALRYYLRSLQKTAGGSGWPEINAEIDIVTRLIKEIGE